MKKILSIVPGVIEAMSEIASLDDAHSWMSSAVRGPYGLIVTAENREQPPRPEQLLELYEFEGCPFCRKVREAMTELDLSYISRTCASGSKAKRREIERRGGKQQFPYLVDANTSTELYESEDIIEYLTDTYGPGRSGLSRAVAPLQTIGAAAASVVRPGGRRVRSGFELRSQPDELPVMYNIEASPFCRKVRETFNELNLDYIVQNVGKFSARRPELEERGGSMMVPYLIDPNRDVEMYESDAIIAYLESNCGEV